MELYETILILNPDAKDKEIIINDIKRKLREFYKEMRIKIEDLGIKELAYAVRGHKKRTLLYINLLNG